MIFVTVGTQLAFPRLVHAVDELVPELGEEVVAQVGPDRGPWNHLKGFETIPPANFEQYFTSARLIVSHAGTGAILFAKQHRKPLVLVPRRFALGEHRNDHQMATAEAVRNVPGIYIAWQVHELKNLLFQRNLCAVTSQESQTYSMLITKLREFFDGV